MQNVLKSKWLCLKRKKTRAKHKEFQLWPGCTVFRPEKLVSIGMSAAQSHNETRRKKIVVKSTETCFERCLHERWCPGTGQANHVGRQADVTAPTKEAGLSGRPAAAVVENKVYEHMVPCLGSPDWAPS